MKIKFQRCCDGPPRLLKVETGINKGWNYRFYKNHCVVISWVRS